VYISVWRLFYHNVTHEHTCFAVKVSVEYTHESQANIYVPV